MSGSGGGSDAELGVSKIDINNSVKRMSKTEGYVSQGNWSKEYFSFRVSGQVLAIGFVVLYFVGTSTFEDLIKNVVYGCFFIFLCIYVAIIVFRHRKLRALREEQLKEYSQSLRD